MPFATTLFATHICVISAVSTTQSQPSQIGALCADVGITAVHLACSGVTQVEASQIVANALESTELVTSATTLSTNLQTQSQMTASLADQLMADATNPDLRAQYESSVASYESIKAQLQSARDAFFASATADLSEDLKQRIQIQASNQDRAVPPEFKVLDLAGESWGPIECAIRAERWSQESGEPLESSHAALLNTIRSDPSVALALSNLESNLVVIENALVQLDAPQ